MRFLVAAVLAFILSDEARASNPPSDCASALEPITFSQIENLFAQYGFTWLDKDQGLFQVHRLSDQAPIYAQMVSSWANELRKKGISFRLPKLSLLQTQGTHLIAEPERKEVVLGKEFFVDHRLSTVLQRIFNREEKLGILRQKGIIAETYQIETREGQLLPTQIHGDLTSENRISRLMAKTEDRVSYYLVSEEEGLIASSAGRRIQINESVINLANEWDEIIHHEITHSTSMMKHAVGKSKLDRILWFMSANKVPAFDIGESLYDIGFTADEAEAHFRHIALLKYKFKTLGKTRSFTSFVDAMADRLVRFVKTQHEILELVFINPNLEIHLQSGPHFSKVFVPVSYRNRPVHVSLYFPANSPLSTEEKKAVFLEALKKRREVVKVYLERAARRKQEFEKIVKEVIAKNEKKIREAVYFNPR